MKILEMNDELFKFRRQIMELLYEARAIIGPNLPYIKVRIVEFEKGSNALGRCFIDKNYITIASEMMNDSIEDLRFVVWHELGHAYFNAKHDNACPLMRPVLKRGTPKEVLAKTLKKIAKRNSKSIQGEALRASAY